MTMKGHNWIEWSFLTPSFLRTLHTAFHNGCTSLHSQQQWKSVSFSPQPLQHLLLDDFFMLAILSGVQWYLSVVLIYISRMVSDVEHFFIYLQACRISFSENCVFISDAHFWIRSLDFGTLMVSVPCKF